jgi:hypothetical protein
MIATGGVQNSIIYITRGPVRQTGDPVKSLKTGSHNGLIEKQYFTFWLILDTH